MNLPIPGVDTILMHRQYSAESINDVEEDIYDALNTTLVQQLPKDEYGFTRGTFHVMVVWTPEE